MNVNLPPQPHVLITQHPQLGWAPLQIQYRSVEPLEASTELLLPRIVELLQPPPVSPAPLTWHARLRAALRRLANRVRGWLHFPRQ
jgi:hypothetical protein